MIALVFLGLCLAGFGLLGAGLYDLRRSMRAAGWPIVPGAITRLELYRSVGSEGEDFEVKVRYTYRVGGVEHEGSRLAFGYISTSGRDAHARIHRKLAETSAVAVRYDPADPSTSCLSFGPHRTIQSTLAFALTWILLMGGIAAQMWLFSRPDSVLLDNLTVLDAVAKPPER